MSAAEFERQKNAKAFLMTALITGALLLLVFMITWPIPEKNSEPVEAYIEIELPDEPPIDVNLGNNDVGSGNVQPIVTGTPSSQPVAQQEVATSRGPNAQQATRDLETDNTPNAPAVTKPANTNTNKEINNNPTDQTVKTPQPQLKAGAQMTSTRGSGNGGNTDLPGYNNPGSQGPGDGAGDKGVQNGNPKGGRYIDARVYNMPSYNFQDEFKESGKIVLDIAVDENGKLLSAVYDPSSTLPKSSKQYDIAMQRLKTEVKHPKIDGGFKQKIEFKFIVN